MKLGVLTDIHLAPADVPPARHHNPYAFPEAARMFRSALSRFVEEGVDALVILGDLSHLGDAPSTTIGLTDAEAAPCPIWIVPGNHDVPDGFAAMRAWSTRIGEENARVAPWDPFHVASTWVVGIALEQPVPDSPLLAAITMPLRSVAAAPIVVLSHFPVLGLSELCATSGLADAGDIENRAFIENSIREGETPAVVLHGHSHVRATTASGPILQLSFASLIEPPHECAIVEIDTGDAFSITRLNLNLNPYQVDRVPITSPTHETWQWRQTHWVPISLDSGG